MNNERRKTLANAYAKLQEAMRLIQYVEDGETDALLNMPSNLQWATAEDPAGKLTNRTSAVQSNRGADLTKIRQQLTQLMVEVKEISDGK